jgi:hypothetical protein
LPTHDHEPGSPRERPPEPPAERSFWALLPRRNFRRALFLIVALAAIIVIKRMGGFSFAKLFDGVAPPPPPAPAQQSQPQFQHLEVKPR